jgi:hypothetical protein
MTNFDRCQEIYDNMCPDDEEGCPECGSDNIESDKYSCKCNDCGYGSEADFEGILEARAEAEDWRNE